MFALTVSESASEALLRAVQDSGLESAVVNFAQASADHSADGLSRIASASSSDAALAELGLPLERSKLVPVKWRLDAGVFPRGDVPATHLVDVCGIWFSFSPEWQELISGGTLHFQDDSYILADAKGNVVLPVKMERYTHAHA